MRVDITSEVPNGTVQLEVVNSRWTTLSAFARL